MNDQICSKFRRILQIRGGETIVYIEKNIIFLQKAPAAVKSTSANPGLEGDSNKNIRVLGCTFSSQSIGFAGSVKVKSNTPF